MCMKKSVVNAAAVEKLSAWFLGKMRVYLKGYPSEEIIVGKKVVRKTHK